MTIPRPTKCLTIACMPGSGIRMRPLSRTPWSDASHPATCTRLYNHFKHTQESLTKCIHQFRPNGITKLCYLYVPCRWQWPGLGHIARFLAGGSGWNTICNCRRKPSYVPTLLGKTCIVVLIICDTKKTLIQHGNARCPGVLNDHPGVSRLATPRRHEHPGG